MKSGKRQRITVTKYYEQHTSLDTYRTTLIGSGAMTRNEELNKSAYIIIVIWLYYKYEL